MALRTIHDATNVEWRVWDVRPSWGAPDVPPTGRAADPPTRPSLAPHLAGGWLAVQSSAGERRRIVPIPDGWNDLADDALLRLVARATVQPTGPKRLIE